MNHEEIINRAVEVFGFDTEKQLAKFIGISQQSFSNRKKSGTLLKKLIELVSELHKNVNLDWFVYGRGSKYVLDDYENADFHQEPENPTPLDTVLLKLIIDGVENHLEAENLALTSELKSRLIALLYDHYAETGEEVNKGKVARYLKLVA